MTIRKELSNAKLLLNIFHFPSGDDENPYGNGQNPWVKEKSIELSDEETFFILEKLKEFRGESAEIDELLMYKNKE